MDAGPDVLAVYLKHYAHLFIKDGREGEVIPTFHISKTTDLNSALDPVPIVDTCGGTQRQNPEAHGYRSSFHLEYYRVLYP
jgi:hypothetical protein